MIHYTAPAFSWSRASEQHGLWEFLTSQTQLLKLSIKIREKLKQEKENNILLRNGNTKMNWRMQNKCINISKVVLFLHICLLLFIMIENAKEFEVILFLIFTVFKNTLVQQEFKLYQISKYKTVIWMIILNLLLRSFRESSLFKIDVINWLW